MEWVLREQSSESYDVLHGSYPLLKGVDLEHAKDYVDRMRSPSEPVVLRDGDDTDITHEFGSH